MGRRHLSKIVICLVSLGAVVVVALLSGRDEPPLVIILQQFDAPLFVVTVNGKQGFIDPLGSVIIDPVYDKAYPFSEDLAAVNLNGKWGFVDIEGNMVIQPQFAMVGFFGDGLAAFRRTYLDPWGYIDKQGKIAIDPQFDGADIFQAGIARVGFQTTRSKIETSVADVGLKLLYRYIDGKGQFVDQPPPSHYAGVSEEELLLIKVGELSGYCRTDGSVVIKPQYRSALPFADGLACVYVDDAWGFIDQSGLLAIDPQFRYPSSFAEGLAGVSIDGKEWGFIDTSGDFLLEPQFGWVYKRFRHGLAEVLVDGKIGYINSKGDWVWAPSD